MTKEYIFLVYRWVKSFQNSGSIFSQKIQELYEWSNELHNCLSIYYKSIQKRETTIYGIFLENCLASYEYFIESQSTTVYGFFIKNKLIFAVEIKDGKVIQAYRKFNQPLNSFENKILNTWYSEFMLNQKKLT